jgi:general stress protein 26
MNTNAYKDDQTFFEFMQLLQRFDVASVLTRSSDNWLLGRPMAIAECTPEAHLRFITRVESSTIKDITQHPEIGAILQSGGMYLSISGYAQTSRDRDRIDRLWNAGQSVWFEKGKNDPSLILLEIIPIYGEFWDRSGTKAIDFKIRQIQAVLTGDTLDTTAGRRHGSIHFD